MNASVKSVGFEWKGNSCALNFNETEIDMEALWSDASDKFNSEMRTKLAKLAELPEFAKVIQLRERHAASVETVERTR